MNKFLGFLLSVVVLTACSDGGSSDTGLSAEEKQQEAERLEKIEQSKKSILDDTGITEPIFDSQFRAGANLNSLYWSDADGIGITFKLIKDPDPKWHNVQYSRLNGSNNEHKKVIVSYTFDGRTYKIEQGTGSISTVTLHNPLFKEIAKVLEKSYLPNEVISTDIEVRLEDQNFVREEDL